jgi:hypothetical protein
VNDCQRFCCIVKNVNIFALAIYLPRYVVATAVLMLNAAQESAGVGMP